MYTSFKNAAMNSSWTPLVYRGCIGLETVYIPHRPLIWGVTHFTSNSYNFTVTASLREHHLTNTHNTHSVTRKITVKCRNKGHSWHTKSFCDVDHPLWLSTVVAVQYSTTVLQPLLNALHVGFWLLCGTMLVLRSELQKLLHVGSTCFKSQSLNQQMNMYLKTWRGLSCSLSFLNSLKSICEPREGSCLYSAIIPHAAIAAVLVCHLAFCSHEG